MLYNNGILWYSEKANAAVYPGLGTEPATREDTYPLLR